MTAFGGKAVEARRAALWRGSFLFLLVSPPVLLGLYLMACWLILAALITPERKRADHTPAALRFYDTQLLSFESTEDQVPLRGWLVPAKGDRVIVLVHGIHSHAWECTDKSVLLGKYCLSRRSPARR
jgi:hypothetical protein